MNRISIRHGVAGPDGALAQLVPFESHGAMSAVPYAPWSTGRLPLRWVQRYQDDQHAPGVVYTVLSYATPIAWVRADGQTVIPPVSYSVTTTRHQNLCRTWLGARTSIEEGAA